MTNAGESVIIANGRTSGILKRVVEGDNVGTLFLPKEEKLTSRKRWIAYTIKPKGKISIDDGAIHALKDKGKSLLASGIASVEGSFQKGDIISICRKGADESIGRGLTNYSADEIEKIKGCSTSHIVRVLGYKLYDEVIHRDNMVIL